MKVVVLMGVVVFPDCIDCGISVSGLIWVLAGLAGERCFSLKTDERGRSYTTKKIRISVFICDQFFKLFYINVSKRYIVCKLLIIIMYVN